MFHLLTATLVMSLAFILPGFAVSYALFPAGKSLSREERLILSFGLSPGIVTLIMFFSNSIVNSFDNVFITFFLILITVGSIILFWIQNKFCRLNVFHDTLANDAHFQPKSFILIFVGIVFLILFFRFYHALIFPIVGWDSLTEFAYLGRLYFQVNRIPPFTGATLGIQSSANFPPMVPLLYTWFYKIYGSIEELFIKAVSPLYSTLTILTTYYFSKAIHRSQAKAWASVFFLASVPIFMFTAEECLSDAPLMFYYLSSLYFLYVSMADRARRNRAMIASGLLAGLAAWTKYNGLFMIFIVFVLFLRLKIFEKRDKNAFTLTFRQLVLFLVFFTFLAAPWYVRNWVVVGNPVYPHLYQIFGGKDIDPWLMQNGFEAHFEKIRDLTGLDASIQSILLTYFNVFFSVPPFEMTDMGPFLGAFILIGIFFLSHSRKENVFIVTWILVYALIWRVSTSTFLRYLVAILPALAILAGHGLIELYSSFSNLQFHIHFLRGEWSLKKILRVLLFLLILEGAFLPTLVNSIRGYKTWTFVNPVISRDEYMEIRLPGWWEAITYINQKTPSTAVILTYDHSIAYYVNRTCIFVDEPRMKEIHLADNINDVISVIRQFNVSHILDVKYYETVYMLQSISYFYGELDHNEFFSPILNTSQVILYEV